MKTILTRIAAALVLAAAFLLAASEKLHADEGSPSFFSEAFFTSPQSPDAWAMTRYGSASLDLFHGTMGLRIPVYTYSDKDFTIPVSLHYASTGFMPGAAVGAAGLGWNIEAGGIITREVRGLPDEESNDYSWKWFGDPEHAKQTIDTMDGRHYEEQLYQARSSLTVFGFGKAHQTSSANLSAVTDFVYTGAFGEEFMAVHVDTLSNAMHYFAIETQPDVFHFSFLGRRGSFILGPDSDVKVFDTNFPADDVSVEFVGDWATPGNAYFVIRTADGWRYDFDVREQTDFLNQGYSGSGISSTSAWKLSKATAPCGRAALFSYASEDFRVSHGVSINVDHSHTFDGAKHSRPWQDAEYLIEHPEVSDTYTTVHERPLSGITVSGCCTISLSYEGTGSERSLQGITVRDSAGRTVRSCTLAQAGSGTHRFLKSVTIPGEGTWAFSYDSEDESFPEYFTRATDMYGYYNGSTSWLNIAHTDATLQAYADAVLAARHFSPAHARMGMMSSVSWPAGGRTDITYEQNSAGAIMRPDNMSATDGPCPGLRVASLTSYDSDGSTVLQKKEYRYETASARSSGVLLSSPELYWHYSYELPWGTTVDREGVRSSAPLGFGLSSHIEYSRVVEVFSDGSSSSGGARTIREFSSTYGTTGNVTSTERYVQQPVSVVETPLDGWYVDFTPYVVHLPESSFLSGGIHAGTCTLLECVSADGLTTSKRTVTLGEYPSSGTALLEADVLYAGHMFTHEYHGRSGYEASSTEYFYDTAGNAALSRTVGRSVGDGGHSVSVSTADSKGNALVTEIEYHPVCGGTPVQVSRRRGSKFIAGAKFGHVVLQNTDGKPYLRASKVYRAYSREGVSSAAALAFRTIMSFDLYDQGDNLLQFTDSTGKVCGIVWDAADASSPSQPRTGASPRHGHTTPPLTTAADTTPPASTTGFPSSCPRPATGPSPRALAPTGRRQAT